MFLSPDASTPPRPAAISSPVNGFAIGAGPGYILVIGRGIWTPAEVDRHFDALVETIRRERHAGREVRVLVDLRQSKAQTGEVQARLGVRTRLAYQAGDRVALILDSSLAKMQMRRVVRTAQHAYFLSPDAALTWLHAYDAPELRAAS